MESCEDMIAFLMEQDKFKPILKRMKEKNIGISCQHCSNAGVEGRARAYLSINPIQIVICKNRVKDLKDTERLLSHELVHAYDFAYGRCDMESCQGGCMLD
jgi:hypothetical protein